MSEFLRHFESSASRRYLPWRGGKILVAVSGGVDSMVLLHGLHRLAAKHRWKLAVAHFNHQLRGRASGADEKLVGSTAEKLSLPFFCERGEVKGFARRSKISVEMAARKLRHEFLARMARQQKIPIIALAHHADDQVELFFLRLLRGAGGEGLAGMKGRSPSPADPKISLVRPLLDFAKAELLEFAREQKIRFREDATNFTTDFLRNRIRNELLPLLRKQYQPQIGKTILRAMKIVGAEAEFTSEVARKYAGNAPASFDRLPLAVQRKILQQRLLKSGVAADFETIELLRETPLKLFSVGSGLTVLRDENGEIQLLNLREPEELEFRRDKLKLNLTGKTGRAEFGGRKFIWSLKKYDGSRRRPPHQKKQNQIEFFDADKVGDEITLRHWRPGDRFQPIGMKSAVKLQDLFVNAKTLVARRRELVLAVAASGEIFWVEGLRVGENFKLTAQTIRELVWNGQEAVG